MQEKMIEIKDVSKSFLLGKKKNAVLRDINLTIYKGETLGILGESGCGKTTLAKVIMGITRPERGEIYFQGEKLDFGTRSSRKKFAKQAQMIFQDPYMSLNPHMTAEEIIAENLEIHREMGREQIKQRVSEMLQMTGLLQEYASRFPHEFSGGQRQRISIARALALQPEFLVCDEPISALDSTIRNQIVNLLIRLKKELGMTYLFISHDINTLRFVADRIAVMYEGEIVEIGNTEDIYEKPCHPYTKKLLQSVLCMHTRIRDII